MPDDNAKSIEERSVKPFFVPSLAIPAFSAAISNTTITLLLLEIATTFQANEGVAAQLRTINSLAEVFFALLMGFLSVRFKHKRLLLFGIFLISFSAIGSFLAPTFGVLLLFSFIEGAGTVIVAIMAFTIIGDTLPLNRKAKAISWVVSAGFVSTLLGTPAISLAAHFGGWRLPFLLLVLPISISGLIIAFFGISSSKVGTQLSSSTKNLLQSIKKGFANRSTASCLVGSLFFPGIAPSLFIVAFFREQLRLPLEQMVYVIIVAAIVYILGSLTAGRLSIRNRTKQLTALFMFVSGLSLVLLFLVSDLRIALVLNLVNAGFTGATLAIYPCLILEQQPESRGLIMSINRVFSSLGTAIVPALGGALFIMFADQSLEFCYQLVGFALGTMSFVAAGIIYFAAKNPEETPKASMF